MVTSRGIEPRSLGLQPSAMTTPARWSLDGADGGSRTRACALRGRRASGNTSSTSRSRLEDSNPDSPVIGRMSCLWTKPGFPSAGVEPAWFRLKGGRMAALPRRVATRRTLAVGPGFEPGSFRLTAGRVAVATSLQAGTNGRVGRTRTSTRLRPRQVGCRLPYDPKIVLG